MTFLQFIEFRGDKTEFDRLLERYRELMGSETTARRTWLLSDRDQPGSLIQIVEFDSYDDAMKNSEHPGTQAWAAEAAPLLGTEIARDPSNPHPRCLLAQCLLGLGNVAGARTVADGAVAVVQNRPILTDITLCAVTAVLDRPVVLDITGGTATAVLNGLT